MKSFHCLYRLSRPVSVFYGSVFLCNALFRVFNILNTLIMSEGHIMFFPEKCNCAQKYAFSILMIKFSFHSDVFVVYFHKEKEFFDNFEIDSFYEDGTLHGRLQWIF